MRNATIHRLSGEEFLITTCDNSGGIGEKEQDLVHVPYDVISYYSFRVAVMECIASGGQPISIIIQNLTGESNWRKLSEGVYRGLSELNKSNITITGSSETNFQLNQSAIGIVVNGTSNNPKFEIPSIPNHKWAVVGKPLVGPSVIEQAGYVAPLLTFHTISKMEEVYVWPVGSKGILSEMKRISMEPVQSISSSLDLQGSAGPSTCFIIAYPAEREKEIQTIAGNLFYPIELII